jgi:hypothetical protein
LTDEGSGIAIVSSVTQEQSYFKLITTFAIISNLIAVLPDPTRVSFYRSREGSEIDLFLELLRQMGH